MQPPPLRRRRAPPKHTSCNPKHPKQLCQFRIVYKQDFLDAVDRIIGAAALASETGDIEADIEAGGVICKGRVQGNILASQKIEMHSKSRVIGDVKTPSINIEIGAVLDGKCEMSSKENVVSG